MDTIGLKGIRVFAHHGVLAEEQSTGQDFLVDVTLSVELEGPAGSDDVRDTIDYGDLAEAVHARVAGERWNLIERVAGRVADLILEDERVIEVEVTVHKPAAPIAVPFEDVAVTVRRCR